MPLKPHRKSCFPPVPDQKNSPASQYYIKILWYFFQRDSVEPCRTGCKKQTAIQTCCFRFGIRQTLKLESLECPRHSACQPCLWKPEVFLRIPDLQTGAASAFQRNYIFQLHIIGQTIFFAGDKFIKSLPYGDAAFFPAIIPPASGICPRKQRSGNPVPVFSPDLIYCFCHLPQAGQFFA